MQKTCSSNWLILTISKRLRATGIQSVGQMVSIFVQIFYTEPAKILYKNQNGEILLEESKLVGSQD